MLNFETFEYNSANCKRIDFDADLDLEINFYDTTDLTCNYYTENQFFENIRTIHGISVILFNARSMSASFQKIEYLLHKLKYKFDVITVSETWFDKHIHHTHYITMYCMYHIEEGVTILNKTNSNIIVEKSFVFESIYEIAIVKIQSDLSIKIIMA